MVKKQKTPLLTLAAHHRSQLTDQTLKVVVCHWLQKGDGINNIMSFEGMNRKLVAGSPGVAKA
jgi:hypothetical protein